ncbi:MAG: hypothetical protein HRT61_13165 [Ekhidna sp.]|nr:hypothetical protein [Ekhidna sp.]
MNEKQLSKEESLELITNMIGQAKRNVAKGGSFYFLLWGWVVALANLGHYLIEKFSWYEHPYIVWILMIPAMIITMIHSARRDRNAKVVSHYDKVYTHLWMAVFIAIIVLLFSMHRLDFNHNAVILLFSGLATYLSGFLLKFKPLILGGIALGVSALIAFNVSVNDQYLVASIALILGYLIPGYLLKKAESEQV